MPPYNTRGRTATYGTSYNLGNAGIDNQYKAALTARQTLANDIYRRLLAIAGVSPRRQQPATPTSTDSPRAAGSLS